MDYGLPGLFISWFHLLMLNQFHEVLSMSRSMANQVEKFIYNQSLIVGNFIDEDTVRPYRKTKNKSNICKKFLFVGSLSYRKKPLLLIDSFKRIHDNGYNCELHFAGTGNLFDMMKQRISQYNLTEKVFLHGQVNKPYKMMSQYDIFILPSLSEGIPRAALEALFIGLPCILRNIDGNSDLIKSGYNGFLFDTDNDLYESMVLSLGFTNSDLNFKDFLPKYYSKDYCIANILGLLKNDTNIISSNYYNV